MNYNAKNIMGGIEGMEDVIPPQQQTSPTGGGSIYDAMAQWYFNNIDPMGRSQQHGRLNTSVPLPDVVGMAPQQSPNQLSQAALQAALKGFTG